MVSPARTSQEVWDGLCTAYGLDPDGYDADIVSLVREELELPVGDISTLLVRHSVPVEQLLNVVLRSFLPLATMLSDLLCMFEQAEATCSDRENFVIAYDFGTGDDGLLPFSLDTFRTWVSAAVSAASIARIPRWTLDQLELLRNIVIRRNFDHERPLSAAAARWSREYDRGEWPRSLPAVVSTGHSELDRQLRAARSMVSAFVETCRRLSADRPSLQRLNDQSLQLPDQPQGEMPSVGAFVYYDGDRWPETIIQGIDRLTATHRADGRPDAPTLVDQLAEATRPREVVEVERLLTSIEEVLSLPAWKRRHELYAAWTLTLIVDAAGPKLTTMHPTPDGKLSFSFSGSHVATITTPQHGAVLVMAELRSSLASPVGTGRKSRIQPDYVLVTPPITAASSAVAVVECKQYRRASAGNFSAALRDYAAGHPGARVLLANYGPARDEILDRVPLPDRDRCVLLEHLRPDEPAQRLRLRAELRHILGLNAESAGADPSEPLADTGDAWATVQLTWDNEPADLDLRAHGYDNDHDTSPTWTVSFENRGSLEVQPFAQLDRDVTEGWGPETITMAKAAALDIVVKQYSNSGTLAGSGAQVRIITPTTDALLVYPPGGDRYARDWHVAHVRPDGSVVTG
ncbi:hypothetical protein [Catellatospora chokoriensis]|nr:hypothetical protein [Catellatospora chokoriensis]